ncbi:hypothetical protein GQ54DRAFT_261622 [Martensiomyces pterosporus]|nr:hypothetical protein GQ54DRAFT_261622 [Martensiomyces pterosporus]
MEQFVSTVTSQVIPLCTIDMNSGTANVPYAIFYENTHGASDFMPSEKLRAAFYLALQQFPMLAGHLRCVGYGRFQIVVDKDNLNMPVYQESTSDVHYSDIKTAGFSQSKWPGGAAPIDLVLVPDADGVIKAANVHIVRLKDNSGLILFLSIMHGAVDGSGYFAFLNHWAKLCKEIRNGAGMTPKQETEFSFDRSLIKMNLSTERKQLDTETHTMLTQNSLLSTWLAWVSPETRGRLLLPMMSASKYGTYVFHVSEDTLESLRSSVCKFVPKGMRVSDNDLLVALLGKTYAQAQYSAREKSSVVIRGLRSIANTLSSWVSPTQAYHVTSIVCDIRHRIGIADRNYVGNAVVMSCLTNPLDEILSPTTVESLAKAVVRVRERVDNVDLPYIASSIDTIESRWSSFMQLMMYILKNPTLLATSNHTRFKMFDADFGDGQQEWASFIMKTPGIAIFMQCPPPGKGANISICADAPVLREMLENEFWVNSTTQIS